MTTKNKAAQALRSIPSAIRSDVSRSNGAKGGRPMMEFSASIENGEGGDTVIKAANLESAWNKAKDWARRGEWEGESVTINLAVYNPGECWPSDPAKDETFTFRPLRSR